MTVWINPIAEESDSEVQSTGSVVNTYSRVYQYRTDALTRPTESDIIADIGIVPGSPYSNDPNATAKKVHIGPGPEMTRPPHLCYHVKIDWATNAPLPADTGTDPTMRRTLWQIRPSIQSTFIIKDRLGKLIVNAAGQPFDGGVPVDVRLGTAIATRVKADAGYDKAAVLANCGKVNKYTYLGGAPGTVQVDIESVEKWEGSYHFWEETFTFNYNPKGHQPQPANAGFFQKSSVAGIIIPITVGDLCDIPSSDGTKVQEPEPLYDDAAEAADPTHASGTVIPYSERPDACSFVEVDFFEEYDFANFGL